MSSNKFKRGDIVKVWSLQSFHGGGFLKGKKALVRQNQTSDAVQVIVPRKVKLEGIKESVTCLDTSYEIYARQVDLVEETTSERTKMVEEFLKLNQTIRGKEQEVKLKKGDKTITPYHYAPEFYFDENMDIQLDKDLLEYPESFV